MNAADFEAFLKEAGNTYSISTKSGSTYLTFVDRGVTLTGIASEDDQAILFLGAEFGFSEAMLEQSHVDKTLSDIQDEYPLVRLKATLNGDDSYFTVFTQQFEASLEAAHAIFFRTVDVIRDAGLDCRRRLSVAPERSSPGTEDSSDYIAKLEAAIQNGCDQTATEAAGPTFLEIRHSITMVIDPNGGSGTAFCIYSDKNESVFATNAHVVQDFKELSLYSQSPRYLKMTGTVIATGDANASGLDLALIAVKNPLFPAVSISDTSPLPDTEVALAGYARVQIMAAQSFGWLVPAIHRGTISATDRDGSIIMHDALARSGNSGGPLFEINGNRVIGIHRAGWDSEEEGCAIGISALRSFLHARGLNYLREPKRRLSKASENDSAELAS